MVILNGEFFRPPGLVATRRRSFTHRLIVSPVTRSIRAASSAVTSSGAFIRVLLLPLNHSDSLSITIASAHARKNMNGME
jgi:hypothetical protein